LLVSRIIKNHSPDFHKKWWAKKETITFRWQSGSRYFRVRVTFRVWLGLRLSLTSRTLRLLRLDYGPVNIGYILSGVCLIVIKEYCWVLAKICASLGTPFYFLECIRTSSRNLWM